MSQEKCSYLRLVPYAPKQGAFVKRVVFRGQRFVTGRWYEVTDPGFVNDLSKLKQVDTDPRSRSMFDVCENNTAMKKLVADEKKAREKAAASAEEPEVISKVSGR